LKLTDKQRQILGVLSPGFGGTEIPQYIKGYLDQGLGGITLFGSNTPNLESTAALIAHIRAINPDCIISIDEESGDVTRLWAKSGSPFPSPYVMGKVSGDTFTESVFEQLGANLAQLDIDLTFAPVLDLAISKDNPIVGVRSFGANPELVSSQGAAAVRGLARAGISTAPKHFPGHGKTSADSHLDLPAIEASLQELMSEDLLPFAAAIKEGAPAMMMGHLLIPAVDSLPASLSSVWINEILRGKLNFNGVVVTDALDMGALGGLENIHRSSIAAIRAGANLLCLSGVSDQSKILTDILTLAESELTDEDLSKILSSKEKIRSLRRNPSVISFVEDLDTSRIVEEFEVIGNPKLESGSTSVMSLGATPTIASGSIFWGLEASLTLRGQSLMEFDTAKNQIVQFRDAWRDEKVLDRLLMLRDNHPDAIFVDFGWPTSAFTASNLIRTFGATRAHADAVAQFLLVD
jgi:beta-N-acetylhexosaminidase